MKFYFCIWFGSGILGVLLYALHIYLYRENWNGDKESKIIFSDVFFGVSMGVLSLVFSFVYLIKRLNISIDDFDDFTIFDFDKGDENNE